MRKGITYSFKRTKRNLELCKSIEPHQRNKNSVEELRRTDSGRSDGEREKVENENEEKKRQRKMRTRRKKRGKQKR